MKVFLGGTCNGSSWRDTLITYLEKVGVDYFNPIVDDWTEECKETELKMRKECEICLYVITPKMTGVYAIAEVVDDSNKRPDKTILAILEEDDGMCFTEGQLKSLKSVSNLVEANGATVCYSLESVACACVRADHFLSSE